MRKVCYLISLALFMAACNKSMENISPPGEADKVLVIKSERKLHLLKNGKIIRTYKVALGSNPVGDKVQEGDKKTPEGYYELDWRNSNSSCYKSIHISYPDEKHRSQANKLNVSPGGSIMIHGLHPSIEWMGKKHSQFDWTYGCIAVSNEEMDEIWNLHFGPRTSTVFPPAPITPVKVMSPYVDDRTFVPSLAKISIPL